MTGPEIYGLIGYPVKHSLSALMHNAAFRALKINAKYRLFQIHPERLEDFLLEEDFEVTDTEGNSCRAGDITGFNITIPHKVRAKEILETEFPFDGNAYMTQQDLYYVKLSGAINTVKRQADKLQYWNTDAAGFLKSLEQDLKFKPKNKKVLLVGCGGAGRAIVASLSWKDVGVKKLYINDISSEASVSAIKHFSEFTHLKDKLEFILTKDIPKIIKDCQLLINATPIGMKERDASIIDKSLLHRNLSVYDVVYNRETQLIKDARSQKCPFLDGLEMLLYQGAAAFELWQTGQEAPIEKMRQALKEGVRNLC